MSKPTHGFPPQREACFALPDMDLDAALPWLDDPEPARAEPDQGDPEWEAAA